MRKKSGLGCELVELLLCLFSRSWLKRGTQQRRDVGHGRSRVAASKTLGRVALFVSNYFDRLGYGCTTATFPPHGSYILTPHRFPLTSPLRSSLADMPSYSLNDFVKNLARSRRRKTSIHRTFESHGQSTTADIPGTVSELVSANRSSQLQRPPAPSSQGPNSISTIYRNTSDAAQVFLPPVQAVADVIPGVGGIIKGVIGGMLSILQLIDVIPLHSPIFKLIVLTSRHCRDAFRINKTWRRLPSDCTSFVNI